MRLSLRDVADRLAERGDRIPPSTLARIEQGKLDPGVRRLHLLLALYNVPPHLVADLVELDTLTIEQPVAADLETLYRDGVAYWKSGDIPRGLAYLFAVREHVPVDDDARLLRQRATLTFAIAARNLGKFRLARQIADDLLCEPPEPSLRVPVLVLASSLWRGLGSGDVALGLIRHAGTLLAPDQHQEAAWVLHQEARLLVDAAATDEAEIVLDRALERYRRLEDRYGELRALHLRIAVLDARRDTEGALRLAQEVVEGSEREAFARLAVSSRLQLGRPCSSATTTPSSWPTTTPGERTRGSATASGRVPSSPRRATTCVTSTSIHPRPT
jgi:tetratricopeptide (TPR) repeat protein